MTQKLETLAVHGGTAPDPTTNARITPICQTASYVFDDADHAARLFNLQEFGNIYSRIMNPAVDALAQTYLGGKGGAVFTFGMSGGYDAGVKLVSSVELFRHLANIGDTLSLIIHPASTTHSQLSKGELLTAGAGLDVVRVSVGIEHIDDIIADLSQALDRI